MPDQQTAERVQRKFDPPWEWRRATGGWGHPNDQHHKMFHAYDVNDNSACVPSLGLAATCEPPNEGSHLCPLCMDEVRLHPGGRLRRFDV